MTIVYERLKQYFDDGQIKIGFEEAKDFIFLAIKDYLKAKPKLINLVKESEKECDIACIYKVEGRKYLVRGEDESTDIRVPVGEISDSNLAGILEQGYEGREKKDRERINEKNLNIIDNVTQAIGTALEGAYSKRKIRRGQIRESNRAIRDTFNERENPEIDKGGQEYDE
jgi:hypothetical protein